jgi:3-oxoacyl-[acyl-carrier-protein] synthase-1
LGVALGAMLLVCGFLPTAAYASHITPTKITFEILYADCAAPGANSFSLFLNDVLIATVPTADVGSVWVFEAKLWGVARVRHTEFFSPDMPIEHPADKFGDAGAAMGTILTVMASKALSSGTRQGPALIWAASDREPRACAVVSVAHD